MKLILSSCILIIFSICFMHVASYDCYKKYLSNLQRETECISEFFNLDELNLDLNATILQYSGNSATVHAVSNKYCPFYSQALQCTLSPFILDENNTCNSPTLHIERRLFVELQTAVLGYVCTNNSSVVVQFLEKDGLHTIHKNQQFDQCFENVERIRIINRETLRIAPELCGAVDSTFECYKNLVRDHENQNLIGITNDVQAIIQQTLNCTPAL